MTCRLQVTPPLLESLFTVAMKGCVPADSALAEDGEMDTVIPVIVTVTEPDAAGFVWEAAVMVTIISPAGGAAGAV